MLITLLPITLLYYVSYFMLIPYYLLPFTLPNVCLLSMLITFITLLPYYFT